MSATHEVAEDLCVVHTSHPILSAENLVDFQRFMGELDRAGRESHFWQTWGGSRRSPHASFPQWSPGTFAPNRLRGARVQTVQPRTGWFSVPFLGTLEPGAGLSGSRAQWL